MDNLTRLERALILDPSNLQLRAELVDEYVTELHYDRDRAEHYCLSIWHPHLEAQRVTRAVRMMEPGGLLQRPMMLLVRAYVVAKDAEVVMLLVTTGDMPPTRVRHEVTVNGQSADVTVAAGASWLLAELEKMVNTDMVPHRKRPRRRRW